MKYETVLHLKLEYILKQKVINTNEFMNKA